MATPTIKLTSTTATRTPEPTDQGTFDYHERIVVAPGAPIASATATTATTSMPATAAGAVALPTVNLALAGLQLLIGYEWLLSGVDKLLYGQFTDQVAQLMTVSARDPRLPDFFGSFLREVAIPNVSVFAMMVQWGETLAGAGLLAGGLLLLVRPLAERWLRGGVAQFYQRGAALVGVLSLGAALGALLMALNYYAMDGLRTLWFQPSFAAGGALDPAVLLAFASVVIVLGRLGDFAQRRHAARA